MSRLSYLMNSTVLLTFLCLSAFAQTPADIRAKFGNPLRETYQINPNLSLSIVYGEDNQACIITKSERNIKYRSGVRLKDEPLSAEEQAREVFDISLRNILQVSKWGKEVKDDHLNQQGNCIDSYTAEYANVSESSFGSSCGENAPFRIYVVEWKREQCKKVREDRKKSNYFGQ